MRLVWAVTCRYAEMAADGTAVIVGAGVDTTTVPELPFELALHLVVKLAASHEEQNTEHELMFKLTDPLLNELGEMRGPLTVAERALDMPDGLDESLVMPTFHIFRVEREGLHRLDLYIDERHCGDVAFYIAVAAPGE